MDVLSILGFILAVGLVMFGMTFDQESMRIVYHNLKAFLDIPSMAITIGGTLGVMMISFPAGAFKKIGSHLKIIVKPYQYSPTDSVDQIVNLATEARMKGLLSLEDKLNEIDEPFLHNSLMLVVDSVDSEKVRKAMETELEQLDERHALDRRFYEKAASFAPAFGMIGTLVGLILMLGNMSDVDALAKGMAVALITTLYGSLLANVVCLPMASKLKTRNFCANSWSWRESWRFRRGKIPSSLKKSCTSFFRPAIKNRRIRAKSRTEITMAKRTAKRRA